MTLDGGVGMRTIGVPVVHAVTNDEVIARADFIDVACAVMRTLGARGALHLRGSRVSGARLQSLAEGLSAAQGLTGAWLIITDRIDVALGCGARGAQLTSRSLAASDARQIAPLLAIGASVHDEESGREAVAAGADWLVAGQVFSPAAYPDAPPTGLTWVKALVASTTVPVIAIGGVQLRHAAALRAIGVHGVAVIRGIWDAPNAERAAGEYLSAYDEAAGG